MKIDPKTTRLISRITDRMDLIRKHPLRYDVDPDVLTEIAATAEGLEALLAKVKTVKVG